MSTRSRTTMRGRSRIEYNSDSQSTELGSVTITVTHLIPAEVTVPVINGQVTEYKNIVTAKTSLETITATEYNVDTIVNTPSHQVVQASSQVAQVNNLLLQQLLLQQQQQQQLQASVAQVMQTTSPNILLSDDLQDLEDGVRFDGDSIIARDNIDDIIAIDDRIHTNKNRKKTRKSNKGQKRNKQQQTKSEEESSVVTLYVSGRRPGSNKRHVKHETAHSSKSESTTDSMSRLQNNQLVAINSDNILNESLDQARFNLATHVMSNGVQLIIASDKIKHIDKQAPSVHSSSISLSSRNVQQKPVTLAPSTLKNHMILAVPTVRQENFSIPIEENQFITKTCLTTYTYHTTYLNKGSTTVESREKIVLNRQTEERKFLRASSKLSLGVTLSNIPELV
ncbi:hypothetical protein AWZ03_014037, partial [Drosophila navojoa]